MKEELLNIYKGILIIPYKVFYLLPQFIYRVIWRIVDIIKFSKGYKSRTLYISEERLNRVEILYYLLTWYIKYGEVNYRFFDYGMDRKEGLNRDHYLGHKKFKELRDSKNYNPFGREDANFNYLCLIRDKFVFSRYLSGFSIPVVKDLAIFNIKTLRWLDSKEECETKAFFMNSNTNLDVFCKPVGGIKGNGVFSLKLINGRTIVNGDDISYDQLKRKITGNYIFQKRIIQHSSINKIYSISVNTIRIVTFYNNGDPEAFLGVLRMGSDGRNIDNFSAGGIVVGIDLESGKLFNYGYHNKSGKPEFVEKHPDTGFRFEGYTLPWFNETVELLKRSHSWMYGLNSIGWDVAITPTGPVIIEANDDWGGILMMITHDGFKQKFMKHYTGKNILMSKISF